MKTRKELEEIINLQAELIVSQKRSLEANNTIMESQDKLIKIKGMIIDQDDTIIKQGNEIQGLQANMIQKLKLEVSNLRAVSERRDT